MKEASYEKSSHLMDNNDDSKMIELKEVSETGEELITEGNRRIDRSRSQRSTRSMKKEKSKLFRNKGELSGDLSSVDEEEDEGNKACCAIFPPQFFSFNLLFYIFIFMMLVSGSLNYNYLSLPYVALAVLLCILSNVPEESGLYILVYSFRLLSFPLVLLYSLTVLIFKIYIINKLMLHDSYKEENKETLINLGIKYLIENKTRFNLICTLGPDIILFCYSLLITSIALISEKFCATESSIYLDIETSYDSISPKKLRRHLFLTYIFFIAFTYFNPSYLSLGSLIIIQFCIGLITIVSHKLIETKYLIIKIVIIFIHFVLSAQIILTNILHINSFQLNYLVNEQEKELNNNYSCKNADSLWAKFGISCTYDINESLKWLLLIGYIFSICVFLSLENLLRYFANASISLDSNDSSKEKKLVEYVDEEDENSFIVRKIKNLLLFICFLLEKKVIISHLCRIFAIIHMYYCQNIYSVFVFFWLFFSFVKSQISSTENYCNFILIPALIASSLCYNICLFVFDGTTSKEKYERDIFTFFGLKRANNYFYLSIICCHVFFVLIIILISSIQLRRRKKKKSNRKSIESAKSRSSEVGNSINILGKNNINNKSHLINLEDSGFENRLKKIIDKNFHKDEKAEKKFDIKNKDLTIMNIIKKKILDNIDILNLIIVYFVAVSSINIVHLVLVIIFIINVLATIAIDKYKRNGYFTSDKQRKVTRITLIIIQLTFFFEFLVDLMKCFFFYDKTGDQLTNITNIMKFILNYNEKVDGSSSEILLFIITYCYYFDYQIYLIKTDEETKHQELRSLLLNDKITFYRYVKVYFKFIFYIYDYIVKIMQQIFIWVLIVLFIFFFCYFELNIFFAIKLSLFLLVVYLFLRIIQKTINSGLNGSKTKIDNGCYMTILWIFLIFCVINTVLVYIYQFLTHDYLYSLIKNTFLVNNKMKNIGFRKYSGSIYIKLFPHFAVNFLSMIFLSEMDNFLKIKQKENKLLRNSSMTRKNAMMLFKSNTHKENEKSKLKRMKTTIKEIEGSIIKGQSLNGEDNSKLNELISNVSKADQKLNENLQNGYKEKSNNKTEEKKIDETFLNDKYTINDNNNDSTIIQNNNEPENNVLDTENNEEDKDKETDNKDSNTQIESPSYSELYDNCKNRISSLKMSLFWSNLVLFFTKSYWMCLFFVICVLFNSYYFSLSMVFYIIIFGMTFIIMFNEILDNLKEKYLGVHDDFDHIKEIRERINISKLYREISFKFLVSYSFVLFFLFYLYGIFDISMKKCNPEIFMGCDNETEKENTDQDDKTNFWTENNDFIKSLSYVFGIYFNTEKEGILSVAWVHLFLCFSFCFDVYIQQIENYYNNKKTKTIKELDEKTLESLTLQQKSLESQADILMNPTNKKDKQQESENTTAIVTKKSLRTQIGEKLVENLSQMVKMYNLYTLRKLRDKDKSKVMKSLKYIIEEVIIIMLLSGGIMKLNIWTFIYIAISLYFIFTSRTLSKFYVFYCFEILFIIIQTIIFVTNIQKSTSPRDNEDDEIFKLIKENLHLPWFNLEKYFAIAYIFGIGVNHEQINSIFYDFILIVILHLYLDSFSYSNYLNEKHKDDMIKPFIKGNPLYDSLIDNPSLKNRDINIPKKDFFEIKNILRINTFIENVNVNIIKYEDFYLALQKLKFIQDSDNMILNDNNEYNFEKQKFLKKLTRKTQQIFNWIDFLKNILYMSSHNFILIIIINISMMIPGIISMIYIFISANFLVHSNLLVKGRRYGYVHFTKHIRFILLLDIALQLLIQFFIDDSENSLFNDFCKVLGFNNLIEFKDNKVIIYDKELSFLIAKVISFFFISLQILIYSSSDYLEYYFIYLVTLTVNLNKTAKINAFKFNNERIQVMNESLSLKEDAYNTMYELQNQLVEWNKIFTSKNRDSDTNSKNSEKNQLKNNNDSEKEKYVDEEEAKQTIKGWIMDKRLIKLNEYIHKYTSPYQNLGNNEMCELEKDIIQGNIKPITYIEFLVDIYLDAISPFNLTEQELKIVESMFNGTREAHLEEINKRKTIEIKEKYKSFLKYDNLGKKAEELAQTLENIDHKIEKLQNKIKQEAGIGNEIVETEFNLDKLDIIKNDKNVFEEEDPKTNVLISNIGIGSPRKEREVKDKSDKEKILNNYMKAKKIIQEEEQKIRRKMIKYEETIEREKKHDKNKYLDDETINGNGNENMKEIKKIDLSDEKFQKFERLQKNTLLFTRYLKNNFIFSCILLDLKSCLSYNFHWFCYGVMILNHMFNACLISFFYPLSIFCYALLEYPRPKKTYWKICLYYTFIILCIKLILSLQVFSFFFDDYKSILDILDHYKIGFKYFETTFCQEFFSYIFTDILIVILLMIYINILVINGTWDEREQEIESIYAAMERVSISNNAEVNDANIKQFNDEFLEIEKMDKNKDIKHFESNHDGNGVYRRGAKASIIDGFGLLIRKANFGKQKKLKKVKIGKIEENDENKDNKEIKKSYFENLFPKKRNEKPGQEYYPIYTGAMIIILMYILIFFNYMVQDEDFGEMSLDVQQFNGTMVIYFIIHVAILISDRSIILLQNRNNIKYKYYLYDKNDINSVKAIHAFKGKTKDEKREYFEKNLIKVEDELIELYPKSKRWQNHSLVIPVQHFAKLREHYSFSYKQIETFNYPLFMKYLLHISIVIFIHVITFIYFPFRGNLNSGYEMFCQDEDNCHFFSDNPSLIIFYIIYLCYMIPSALQIKYGFLDMKGKSILKRSTNEMNNLILEIYQKIPFLTEIKNIYDWTLTGTCLELQQWIQFEAIYDTIYSAYCDGGDDDGDLGQKIANIEKAKTGGVLSFILIVALVGPMIIFSSLNPTNILNSLTAAKLKVDLSFSYDNNVAKKYTLFSNERPESITEMTDDIFEEFNYTKSVKTRSFPQERIQTVKFYDTSDKNWDLVLPHIQSISHDLNVTDTANKVKTIDLIIETDFTRPLPAEAQTIEDEIVINIYDENHKDYEGIEQTLNLSNALVQCNDTNLTFDSIYTPSRKLSSSTEAYIFEDSKYFYPLGIQIGFMGCDSSKGVNDYLQSYFTLRAIVYNKTEKIIEPISFHIFSETISPTTSNYSVFAFYTAVILVFGEYVRDFCSGEPEKVMLNELPEPEKLIHLCEGINIARNSNDFKMEKKLYFILIEFLREPTYLREITKSSVEKFEEMQEANKYITTDDID